MKLAVSVASDLTSHNSKEKKDIISLLVDASWGKMKQDNNKLGGYYSVLFHCQLFVLDQNLFL